MENGGTESSRSFAAFKETIAEKLDRAAGSLGRQSETGQASGPYSRQASEWLHQSAQYIRAFDMKRADADLKNQISLHPGKSVLISLAAGFALGFMLRRR
jgi:hypothetical protein